MFCADLSLALEVGFRLGLEVLAMDALAQMGAASAALVALAILLETAGLLAVAAPRVLNLLGLQCRSGLFVLLGAWTADNYLPKKDLGRECHRVPHQRRLHRLVSFFFILFFVQTIFATTPPTIGLIEEALTIQLETPRLLAITASFGKSISPFKASGPISSPSLTHCLGEVRGQDHISGERVKDLHGGALQQEEGCP